MTTAPVKNKQSVMTALDQNGYIWMAGTQMFLAQPLGGHRFDSRPLSRSLFDSLLSNDLLEEKGEVWVKKTKQS